MTQLTASSQMVVVLIMNLTNNKVDASRSVPCVALAFNKMQSLIHYQHEDKQSNEDNDIDAQSVLFINTHCWS